jgi:hypothetical protein
MQNTMSQKKPNRAFNPLAWENLAIFSDFWRFFPDFFEPQKITIFGFQKFGAVKKSRFWRFFLINR